MLYALIMFMLYQNIIIVTYYITILMKIFQYLKIIKIMIINIGVSAFNVKNVFSIYLYMKFLCNNAMLRFIPIYWGLYIYT